MEIGMGMVTARARGSLFFGCVALLLGACPQGGDGDPSGATAASTGASASASATASASDGATSTSSSGGVETGGSGGGSSGDATSGDATGGATSTGDPPTTGDTATTGEPVDPRLEALATYAPRVWLDKDEEYFPSSVEFAFASMTRFADGEGKFWIRSTDPLESPSDTLPFFGGDLESAPVYAFYADKGGGVVDLVYFFWYPYNRGKSVVDTIWGNHVGDWEHITVRLMKGPGDELTPIQAYLSAHSFGGVYEWVEIERYQDTHPVVYSAWGSHGVWSTPGDHVYMSIGETDPVFDVCITLVCTDLTDVTSAGIAWDTWERVAGFDYFAKEGLGGEVWPVWMSDQFTDPGADPIDVPGGGPIFRWGNEEDCSTLGIDISDLIGVCRLEDGPTGPISKDVWGPELK
ncbi:MAG: Vps62-related protein [Myxococcales bacterium]|nr:Vps62-related protein [Myxococcales bacterium]